MSIALSLFGGFGVLLLSTRYMVDFATKMANALRLSPLVVGVTIVAIGTSLPELVVSVLAASQGDYALAVGNVMGSNIINILVVLGLGILLGNLKVGAVKTQKTMLFLVAATFFYLLSFYVAIPAALMILFSIGFFLLVYRWGIAGRNLEDRVRIKFLPKKSFSLFEWVVLALCLFGMYLGGATVVSGVEKLAVLTGIATHIFGMTLTAVATSLPEILTTIISVSKTENKLLLGNIMGSNVYNILFIGGLAQFWKNTFNPDWLDILWLAVCTLGFGIILFVYRGRVIPRFFGIVLLLLGIGYFSSLV